MGAAEERAARAKADAALSEARVSLRDTNNRLQESLDNVPKAAVAALLEEKKSAEAKAAAAIKKAEAAVAAGKRALKEKRGEELSLLETERDEVSRCL